jgi:hypothetical protein
MNTDIKTFNQLQKDVYDRIVLVGHSPYHKNEKVAFGWKNYLTVHEVSKLQEFVTDAQWKSIAQLCIRFNLNIKEIVDDLFFEDETIWARDESCDWCEVYYLPTVIKGWFGGIYYMIETNGDLNT